MQEFSSVIASSYDADSLAPMLTDKAREGWTVVSIVAAGTNVVAYLSRDAEADAVDSGATDGADSAPAGDEADATETLTETSTAVEEPAGWGAVDDGPAAMESASAEAPTDDARTGDDVATAVTGAAALSDLGTDDASSPTENASPDAQAESAVDASAPAEASADETPAGSEAGSESAPADEGSAPADEEPAAAEAPADAGVPAGWYADPSGRYELRYWDGTGWTEHVSRAGQQYTDPPVA